MDGHWLDTVLGWGSSVPRFLGAFAGKEDRWQGLYISPYPWLCEIWLCTLPCPHWSHQPFPWVHWESCSRLARVALFLSLLARLPVFVGTAAFPDSFSTPLSYFFALQPTSDPLKFWVLAHLRRHLQICYYFPPCNGASLSVGSWFGTFLSLF